MQMTILKTVLLASVAPTVDVLFSLIVVAPLVVTFWATTWALYDLFIFPTEPVLSGAISWSFGFFGQIVLIFYQDSLKKLLVFEKHNFVNIMNLKVYALFLGHISVSFWRGVWSFLDATSSRDQDVVVKDILQNMIILMILKALTNTLVPPFFVLTDQQDQYSMRTLLQKCKSNGSFTYFVDCLSTMFVQTLIAFIWHDLWFIHDTNIFPDDPFYSALTSLVIGYSLAITCFASQRLIGILCEKYNDQKVFIYDAFTVIVLLSAINVWRGIWSFILYFADNNTEWNLILNTLAWVLLMLVNCTLCLTAKDIVKDAEKSGKDCTKFQTQYFSKTLFHETDIKLDKPVTLSTHL